MLTETRKTYDPAGRGYHAVYHGAVALTTDGIAAPNSWGFSGSRSAEVLLGSSAAGLAASCAMAVPATARITAAAPKRARVDKNPEPAATIVKSLAEQ